MYEVCRATGVVIELMLNIRTLLQRLHFTWDWICVKISTDSNHWLILINSNDADYWDHVYLRHLSTECRSILLADMATDTRLIYRLTLGRVSVDMNRHACRPTPDRYFTATRPPNGRQSAAARPIVYQNSANTKLTWSALAAEFYLPCSTERGFQRACYFRGVATFGI